MSVIATEGQYDRYSALVKSSDTPEDFRFHADLLTVNEAAQASYGLGTVLGKVTATGKYVISKQNAADGSQTPVAIVVADSFGEVKPTFTVAATTDTKVLAIVRGKVVVSKEALKLDATYDNNTKKAAAYAALAAQGILVEASY